MTDLTMFNIIEFIKIQMYKQGVTQKLLAEQIGIMSPTLSQYLAHKRKMPFDLVEKSLEYLGFRLGIYRIKKE